MRDTTLLSHTDLEITHPFRLQMHDWMRDTALLSAHFFLSFSHITHPFRLQMYDWMRDTTPEEEAEMKSHAWDLEETKFGTVKERYRQPSLVNHPEEHAITLSEARTVEANVRAFNAGEKVRPVGLHLQASTVQGGRV